MLPTLPELSAFPRLKRGLRSGASPGAASVAWTCGCCCLFSLRTSLFLPLVAAEGDQPACPERAAQLGTTSPQLTNFQRAVGSSFVTAWPMVRMPRKERVKGTTRLWGPTNLWRGFDIVCFWFRCLLLWWIKRKKKKRKSVSVLLSSFLPPETSRTFLSEARTGRYNYRAYKGSREHIRVTWKYEVSYRVRGRLGSLHRSGKRLGNGNRHLDFSFTKDNKGDKGSTILWRRKNKNTPVTSLLGRVSWYLRPTLVFLSYFLLDVLQEGCPGVHNCFEGIFATRRHALVRVKQHREFPVGFVDFVPRREQQGPVSATGRPRPCGRAAWSYTITLAEGISPVMTAFRQKRDRKTRRQTIHK